MTPLQHKGLNLLADLKKRQRAALAVPKPGKCGGCSAPPIHHWLGMDWYGVPAPVRVWKWLTGQTYDARGCGCCRCAKDFWDRLNKPRPVKV